MLDLEGNDLREGHTVYILDSTVYGSKSTKMLRGEVVEIKGLKCKVLVPETNRIHGWKTGATVLRPME